MAKAVFRASTRGARRAGHKMRFASRAVQRDILDVFGQQLGPEALRVHREHAPHRSGALERGLQARIGSRGGRVSVEVISTVRSREGYPYTNVTRFGHRGEIRPKRKRALAFNARGQEVVVVRSRGYHPASDWVEHARPESDAAAGRAADEIGRRIASRVL